MFVLQNPVVVRSTQRYTTLDRAMHQLSFLQDLCAINHRGAAAYTEAYIRNGSIFAQRSAAAHSAPRRLIADTLIPRRSILVDIRNKCRQRDSFWSSVGPPGAVRTTMALRRDFSRATDGPSF